jgi:NitT/TauT family transport system ATP-binding protein
MVSHDIKEVVYMADRIVVLDANPGRVRTVVENPLPRPRDYRAPALLQLVDRLHDIITGMEMPDVAPLPTAFEALPRAGPNEILGLLEYLDARGGQEDVFKIAADTDREFGRVIAVVNAAELLDLVDTPKRLVVLSPEGQQMVKASPADRKALFRGHILKLRLFQHVSDAATRQEEHRIDRDFVLELVAVHMPNEDYEAMFETFVAWGRFADLLSYDDQTGTVVLPSGS